MVDVLRADVLFGCSDLGISPGGSHSELGIVLGRGKPAIIVGNTDKTYVKKMMPSDCPSYVIGIRADWDRHFMRRGRKKFVLFWGDDEENLDVEDEFGMDGIRALHDLCESIIAEYDTQ